MQQLHLVGVTTEHDSLIFSVRKGAKSGSFVLPLDEHLVSALADAIRRRNADGVDLEMPVELDMPSPAPRRQSQLSPREIQDRLRAGRSLEEIAAEAGVGEEWVARFAAPVDAERSQIITRARELTYAKPRRGDSAEPLGLSVRWNLAERGVRMTNDEFTGAWSGYQVTDETWMVTFAFVSRKRQQAAEWEVDLETADLVGRNRLASDLGYVEPGRRRRSITSMQPTAATSSARKLATAGPDPRSAAEEEPEAPIVKAATRAKRATAKKATAKKATAKRAAPAKRATAKRVAPAKRATKAMAKKVVPTKPTKRATGTRAPAKKSSSGTRTSVGRAASTAKRGGAKRAAATRRGSATKRRTPAKTTKRGAPAAVVAATPVVATRPVPNELGQRRLQLIAGQASGSTARSAPGRSAPSAPRPQPTSAARIAAPRSVEAAARVRSPEASTPSPRPEPAPPRRPAIEVAVDGLDLPLDGSRSGGALDNEALAEARRIARREARSAARQRGGASVDPNGEDRVVSIRANRAAPPRGEAEIILPQDLPPLRPAQPATQPRKRLFGRTGRPQ